MESPEILEMTARQLDAQRRGARDDNVQQLADQAWSETALALRHAKLVDIFVERADAARNRAVWLASRPDRQELAERTREDATRLYRAAARHRHASEQHELAGDRIAAQLRQYQPEPAQPPPVPPAPRRGRVNATVRPR